MYSYQVNMTKIIVKKPMIKKTYAIKAKSPLTIPFDIFCLLIYIKNIEKIIKPIE